MKSPPSSQSAPGFRPALYLVVACGAVLTLCGVLYWQEAGQIELRVREREAARASMLAHLVQFELRPVAHDLLGLAQGDGLLADLSAGRPGDLESAVHRAEFYSRQEPDYDQIRLLDEHGREILRVNRGGRVVAAENLEDQSDRANFRKALPLLRGDAEAGVCQPAGQRRQIHARARPGGDRDRLRRC